MRWALTAVLLALAGCVGPRAAPPPPAAVVQAKAPVLPPARFELSGPREQGGVLLGKAPLGTVQLAFNGVAIPIASDGRFLIAFDRDAAPAAELVATRSDGSVAREPIAVAPRAWRVERLPTLPRISQPSEEFQRRRPPELARIAAARAKETGAEGWRQVFRWPATGRVSGLFGAQRIYRGEPGSYHGGVDVAKPTGTPIYAPADGTVILAAAAPFTLEGNLLMIDHGMGLNSAFLHLSAIEVTEGQAVRQGQLIGRVGATGRATGPHLHWGLTWRGARLDPLLLAGPMPAE